MSDTSAILSLPYIQPAQAQKHVTHNEAVRLLDILVQLVVATRDENIPPAVPAEGECHIVGQGAVGAWAGQDDTIAVFDAGQWQFLPPKAGWRAHVLAENLVLTYSGSVWQAGGGPVSASRIGINTAPDAINRLSLSASATLFNNDGAGHQLKINKAAAGDTASLLFQTGFSGRAEMGLAGTDDFSVKVSADGAAFTSALSIDALTGQVTIPVGLVLNGPLTGAALTQSVHATTPGQVLKVGDYGWGQTGNTQTNEVLNQILVSGVHQFASNDANKPGSTGGAVLVIRYADNVVTQIVFGTATSDIWARRTQDNGINWSSWTTLTNERGSGSNGEYVRFPDGTLICTRGNLTTPNISTSDGALFKSANATWTFPSVFAAPPRLIGANASDADAFVTPVSTTTTQGVVRVRSTVSKTTTITFGAMAIGRWY